MFFHVELRKTIKCSTVNLASCFRLLNAAPLLEEEGDAGAVALFLDVEDPLAVHWAGTGAAFAADDYPLDAGEIDRADVFEEGFDGEEGHGGGGGAEVVDAGEAVFFVFDADAPPDVRQLGGGGEFCLEEVAEAIGTLGEDLVGVPVGGGHDFDAELDVFIGHLLVK